MTADTLLGRRLGGFDVRELLGSGGMASVYKGYDPALDREVAIKIISTAGQSPDFVARFQREARVVAKLRHPNIVQIYQFGEEQGFVYMVQELLAGPTLQQRMRDTRRKMTRDRVVEILSQLAAALDFAHGQGVIHRDIKPSNALYNSQGQIVLTDFGIARTEADAQRTMTGPGVVMGTPGYLAPEQAVGSVALTPACDIYALGVVAFELLTGRLPFDGESSMSVILKHLYDEPPRPGSIRSELPRALDTAVLRALEKEPRKRFASAGAFVRAVNDAWPATTAASTSTPKTRATSKVNAAQATPPPAKAIRTTPVIVDSTPKPRAQRTPAKGNASPTPAKGSAAKTTPKPNPPAPTPIEPTRVRPAVLSPEMVPTSASRYDPWPLRVGMITVIVVSLLLISGYNQTMMYDAWIGVLSLFSH